MGTRFAAALLLVLVCGVATPPPAQSAQYTHGSMTAGAYWWGQGPADCAPMAARVVVGAVTGAVIDPADIDATAARVAGYGPDGTDWALMPALLAEYGVATQIVDGATLDDMRAALDTTGPAIVLINGETVWARFPRWIAVPGTKPDHAVVLDQIDDAAHTVTLVDSGTERSETVPTPTFLAAWAASRNSAVVVSVA